MTPPILAPDYHRPMDRTRTASLFAALFFSDFGGWVQLLVTTWVVLRGPHPALWLPVLFAARSLPKLAAAPFAGTLADRFDRLQLYRISRALSILPPLGLAAATSGLLPQIETLLVATVFGALLASLDQPARRGLLWDVGGRARVIGTVSLGSAAFHCAASLAPALAVLLVGSVGSTGALEVTALIAVLSAVATCMFTRLHGAVGHGRAVVEDRHPLGGVSYLLRTPSALALVLLTGMPGLAGRTLAIAIPALAGDHAHSSLLGTGALASAPGAGALVAAVALALLGEVSDKSRFALVCVMAFGACIGLSMLSNSYYGDAFFLAAAGAASASFGTVIFAMLHLQVPDHLRCRVMAI